MHRLTRQIEKMTVFDHRTPTCDEIVARVTDLTTLPDLYLRVKNVIDDPNASHADLADVLSIDPVISARLLRVANSAFYGLPSQIATISRAVNLLGTQQVHDLVLATTVVNAFGDIPQGLVDPSAFWHGCLLGACGSKVMAERCNILDSEHLFVAGLLAQIGKLILYRELPDEMRELLHQSAREKREYSLLQREYLGFDYADVSAQIFRAWRLPEELTAPIGLHTRPEMVGEHALAASIVHIGVAMATGEALPLDQILEGIADEAWHATSLSPEEFEYAQAEASDLAHQIAPSLLDAVA